MEAEPLLSLAAAVGGEHAVQDVLNSIVRGLAGQPGVSTRPDLAAFTRRSVRDLFS